MKSYREQEIDMGLTKENGYEYLGWENAWYPNKPEDLKKCDSFGHKRRLVSLSNRGTHDVYICDICKIYYNLDCGD